MPAGTVTRARATCLCCGTVLPPERVRAQLAAQRGGADVVFDAQGQRTGGARLLAVVMLGPASRGGTIGCPPSATTTRCATRKRMLRRCSTNGNAVAEKGPLPGAG